MHAISVVRASILELCALDHNGDGPTLARWLGNKTIETFAVWLRDPNNYVVVGVLEGDVKGVGLIEKSGDLRLCYVHPDHQRRGLGRAIVDELEKQATRWGLCEIRLTSSANAKTFYERHGYVSAGQPIHEFGVLWDYPYRKQLTETNERWPRRITLEEALRQGPPPPGNQAIPIFRHGSLEVEMYAPIRTDHQKPHERDEVYVVARGTALFFNGREQREVLPGSFIFVPAKQQHRFESMSPDFAVWVLFYGPSGGET